MLILIPLERIANFEARRVRTRLVLCTAYAICSLPSKLTKSMNHVGLIETRLPISHISQGTLAETRKLLISCHHQSIQKPSLTTAQRKTTTMNSSAAISKIFWPSHLCSQNLRTGFIIGWNVRSFTACIATVVSDIDVSNKDTGYYCSIWVWIKL